ncbi:MAG: TPM domain-containing protein [Bacteroidetes bacterium]|nr:TPM domain-containing protein [Bacteroidota bacterium]
MRKLIQILSYICIFNVHSFAYEIPKATVPPKLVNDYTQTLTSSEIEQLEAKVVAFDDSTSNQVAIVLINTLNDEDINQVAYDWATSWGIGRKGKDNGVLILCAMQDHKIKIEVGTGLEPRIVDGQAGTIIRKIIGPNFKKQAYFQGLNEAVDEIIYLCGDEFHGDPREKKEKFSVFIMIGFIILIIIILIIGGRGKGGGRRGYSGYTYFPGGGFGGFGGGGSSSGSSGGGFGGFGGGGFSGGGASGSW